MSSALDGIRKAAVSKAVCPVSLVDLREKPEQVGAFVYKGQRVEAALYHKDSVLRDDGSTIFRGRCTPVDGRLFDGFELMPLLPLRDASAEEWEEFVEFFHYQKQDDWLLVSEVATAFAASINVDEDGVERFIRSHFDVEVDGRLHRKELDEQILPYLSKNLDKLQDAAPVRRVPRLWRNASQKDVLGWFVFWDYDKRGEVELVDFHFAIACTLYEALGFDVDVDTKEGVVAFFLSEAIPEGSSHISRAKFIDGIFPALQANLPDLPVGSHSLDPNSRGMAVPLLQVTVEDTSSGKFISVEVPESGNVAILRKAVERKLDGPQELIFDGRSLIDSSELLKSLTEDGSAHDLKIKAVPSGSNCVIS